ncbi:MAG: hypothetical protein J6Y94_09335 [Bacteriovoracaceae bacterium]|nr:hypothetical protein [Bacteriovoracaceae bacterium]
MDKYLGFRWIFAWPLIMFMAGWAVLFPAAAQDVEIEDPEIQAIANSAKDVGPEGREVSPEELEAYRQQVQSMMLSSNPEAAPIEGMGQFLAQSAKTLQSMSKEDLKKHLGQTLRYKKFDIKNYPKLLDLLVEVITDPQIAKSFDVDPQLYFKRLIYLIIFILITAVINAIWRHRDQKKSYRSVGVSLKDAVVRFTVINLLRLAGMIYIFREQFGPIGKAIKKVFFT